MNWALGVCGTDFGVGSKHKVSSRGGSMGVGLRMNLAEICSYRVGIGVQEIRKKKKKTIGFVPLNSPKVEGVLLVFPNYLVCVA